MREILALEHDARAARGRREPLRFIERRRPSDVITQQLAQLTPDTFVGSDAEVGGGQLLDRRDQRLGHKTSAVGAVVAARVRVSRAEYRALAGEWLHDQCRMLNAEC